MKKLLYKLSQCKLPYFYQSRIYGFVTPVRKLYVGLLIKFW